MIVLLLSVFCLFHPVVPPSETHPSLEWVRAIYSQSAENKDSCRHLMETLEPYNEKNEPLLAGYKAAACMIMARHVLNPISKLTYFERGRSLLERAIAADGSSIELRFLRYTIQTNCPAFLGYRGHIGEDRKLLLKYVHTTSNTPVRTMVINYMARRP